MKGFSLVELAIVVMIAAVLLAAAAPVFRDVLPGTRAESASRRLRAVIGELYNEAVFTGQAHVLVLNIDEGTYEGRVQVSGSGDEPLQAARGRLPEGVSFEDVESSGELFTRGEARIFFDPAGFIDPSLIRLGDGKERTLTIVVDGFTGRARVEEGYVRETFEQAR